MTEEKEILFSSFLAGFLLVKKDIDYLEISKEIALFERSNNSIIIDPDFDFQRLYDLVIVDNLGFHLALNYDNSYIYNNSLVCIKDYLYDLTTQEVRYYFGIEEKEIINIYNSDKNVKKKSVLTKVKRTKVYV